MRAAPSQPSWPTIFAYRQRPWARLEDHNEWVFDKYGLPESSDKLNVSDIIEVLAEMFQCIGVADNKLLRLNENPQSLSRQPSRQLIESAPG